MGFKLIRSSPYYAQANGQAEASNQSLIKVDQVLPGNAYMLEELDGVKFPVAVNGQHLKKYFPSMWEGD